MFYKTPNPLPSFDLLYDVMKVKVTQSCPTLCNPRDYTVHGLLQARILEWVAFPFSGDLPNPGIEPRSPRIVGRFFTN